MARASSFRSVAAVRWPYAVLLVLIGDVLFVGGLRLLQLGGSPYYALAGATTVVSGALIFLGDRRGIRLYQLLLLATTAWAIWEVGFDGWWLAPRLAAPFVLGLGMFLPQVRGGQHSSEPQARTVGRLGAPLFLLGLIAAVGVGAGLRALGPKDPADPIYQAGVQAAGPALAPQPAALVDGDWRNYGNDPGGTRFSPLDQLTPQTVGGLKEAWRFHVGPGPDGEIDKLEVTPLKVGDSIYLCTSYNDVISLDAETGRQNWRFRSHISLVGRAAAACRGVAYYRAPGLSGPCAERVITNTIDARLIALDARTGALCEGFGDHGQASLLTGMGPVLHGFYFVSSAPTIVRGKIVLGGYVFDNQYWGEPAGAVRAFDAVTGRFAWAFDAGRPDEHGEPPPGQTYTLSTPNSWAPMTADESLGLVYVPTGIATPDYFGGQRRPFDDKYDSSVIALDARTGAVRWTFQTVHHDLWDYDTASQPTLVDIHTRDGVQHALVQATKRGEIFLLDRITGRPLAPVVEHAAPRAGAVREERLSPTQPYSDGMPSVRGRDLSERAMWGVTPVDQLWCRIRFREARYDGPMTPPGLTPAVVYPGYLGGVDWGGVSVDPDRGLLFVNSSHVGNYDVLIPRAAADRAGVMPMFEGLMSNKPRQDDAQAGTPYAADVRPFLSHLEAPCNAPPFGSMAAIDLRTHKLVWNRPLGRAQDSGVRGLKLMLPITMGTPNMGGSVATRGGLVFIAATQEATLRAIDSRTGKDVWTTRLPAGGQATPSIYRSDKSGRQFVVLAASGNLNLKSRTGDYIIAYALPR